MARLAKRRAESDAEEEDGEDLEIITPSDDIDNTSPTGSVDVFDEETSQVDRRSTPPSDLESENEDNEQAATQAIREKRAEQRGNEPAECGILVKVEVYNFMCHEQFIYELGPLINFICGKNGSGKSAILTAIVLCLGGKAAATNRGQSLKNFIKEGKEQARIICHIKNEGEGAYMPEDYGDVIEIERYFSKNGSSGFKIKSERGRIVSTKKMDLEEICDHFALQIDNPLNVLSQDMARQFITASNAADKYRFFVKGVQLEQLDQDYRLIEDQIENIQASIETRRPDIKFLEDKWRRAKVQQDALKMHDGLRQKLRELRREIVWVQVRDQEVLRDEIITNIEAQDRTVAEAEANVIRIDDVYQASCEATEAAKAALEEAKAQLKEVEDDKQEVKAQYNEIKAEVSASQLELRTVKTALESAQNSVEKKLAEIETEERRLAEINGGGAAERLHNLEAARAIVEEKRQIWEAHAKLRPGLDQQSTLSAAALSSAADKRTTTQAQVNQRQDSLDELTRNRDSHDTVFHPNMPALLRAISQENGFQQRPIGPLGKHIRLLRPEWSSVIEKSFGSTLSSFLVTSKQDSSLLSELMKRTRCFVPAIIGNNEPIDTAKHEPAPEFLTVLRALEIDNDMVRKQLVIAHAVEQTILIADSRQASEVMFDDTKPVNVKRCYTMVQGSKRRGIVLSYTRNGDASQDPIQEFTGRARMRTDIEVQIRALRDALQEAKDQAHGAEQIFYEARNNLTAAQQAVKSHDKQTEKFKLDFQNAEDKIEELQNLISEDNVEGGVLEALKEALAAAKADRAINEGSFKDAVVNSDARKAKLRSLGQQLNTFDSRIADLSNEVDSAQAVAQRADTKRAHDVNEKNKAVAQVDDAKRDRQSMEAKLKDKERDIESYIGSANQICLRINVSQAQTHAGLEQQYKAMKKEFEAKERQMGASAEEITRRATAAANAYKQASRDLRDLERLSGKLKGSLIERKERWKKFRSHISVRAKAQFTYLLSERSFRGRLITDHKQKLLELSVEPDITKRDGSGRSTRTLSGGEKSFSQICLLLSIWEAMGSPIRCLDEFDVFMDAVNRNLSVNLLVEAARQSIGRQFILISPGTKNDIQRAPDIHAHDDGIVPEFSRKEILGKRIGPEWAILYVARIPLLLFRSVSETAFVTALYHTIHPPGESDTPPDICFRITTFIKPANRRR
ncbi:hypothetical protein R6Q59_010187 [Mikania micrantha]